MAELRKYHDLGELVDAARAAQGRYPARYDRVALNVRREWREDGAHCLRQSGIEAEGLDGDPTVAAVGGRYDLVPSGEPLYFGTNDDVRRRRLEASKGLVPVWDAPPRPTADEKAAVEARKTKRRELVATLQEAIEKSGADSPEATTACDALCEFDAAPGRGSALEERE